MYARILFCLTLLELLVIGGGHLLHWQNAFYNTVMYGSPLYLLMNLLGSDSAFLDKNPVFIAFMVFHILKYLLFWRAVRVEETGWPFVFAVIFEGLYLALSGYYIN